MAPVKTEFPKVSEIDAAKAEEATRHLRSPDPGTWRATIRPIVAELVEMVAACNMDERDAAREFREAWRWGPRRNWPYRVWRDEIALQLGRTRGRITPRRATAWLRQRQAEAAGQIRMFE